MTLEVEGSNAVGHRVGVVVGIRSLEDGKQPVQAFETKIGNCLGFRTLQNLAMDN